jgi:hypothetical protein
MNIWKDRFIQLYVWLPEKVREQFIIQYPVEKWLKACPRTLAQNALLHIWIRELQQKLFDSHGEWHSEADWKDEIKRRFLKVEVTEFLGETRERYEDTSNLEIEGFSELLERIDHWAADDLGIVLSHPAEYKRAMYEEG